MDIPYTFIQDVEKKLKYILYTDTDSLYINVPNIKPKSAQEAVDTAQSISEEINTIIHNFNINQLFPKFGVDPNYDRTDYKTELVADSMLLLDSKKNYAYRILAKEGKIFENPEVKYTGIPVVRSDYSRFTRDLIREIVEKIALNKNKTEKTSKLLQEIATRFHTKLKTDIENYDFLYIGTPCKWGLNYKNNKLPFQVIAMKLYNTITDTPTFSPMSAGLHLPINIENSHSFLESIKETKFKDEKYLGNTPLANLTKLTVPYSYDKEILKEKMIEFGITIDFNEAWDTLYSKVAQRIVEIVKELG